MTSGFNAPADARARAEAKFLQAERRRSEAEQALSEVNAAKVAEAAKTARLRALRLAKEEADRAAAATQPAKAPSVAKRKVRRISA